MTKVSLLCIIGCVLSPVVDAAERPNVLFVSVDDLRPELGCYGNAEIRTPHFDAFSKTGTTFMKAYCQAAVCAPSRASVMTGLRPDSTRVWDLRGKFRQNLPDVVTMPQHFHKHGYYTVSMGKIFHNHMPDLVSFDEPDLRPQEYMTPELIDREPESFYHDSEIQRELAEVRKQRLAKNPNRYADGWAYGRATESFDGPDRQFYDGAQTDLAISTMKRLKEKNKPFFLALGYYRPHLPFVAPKRYWDLYDRDLLSLADNPFLPKDSPVMAMNSCYELRGCYDLEHVKHPSVFQLSEAESRRLKHGYYASVSFVDACFGKLLHGLDELGLADNTIVVVWGDHGWKLGEHGSWCKQTNYDIDVRVPLLIRVPGQTAVGSKTNALVELVDLYPTLCDAADIPVPSDMEGTSFEPLLSDPNQVWKLAAFSQFHRAPKFTPDQGRYMGLSMVTDRFHYVEWRTWDHLKGETGEVQVVELYDLQTDPSENVNVAGLAENETVLASLADQLKLGWQNAKPADAITRLTGPTSLFNGIDLTGWHVDIPAQDRKPDIKPTFVARDGMLVSLGSPQGHLITDANYQNYRINVEYRFAGKPGNCGVLVHASTPRSLYSMFPKSVEVQMNHQHAGDFWCIVEDIIVPDMIKRRGPKETWGITEGKARRILNLTDDSEKPVGEWNSMTIECVEDEVKVWVNGDFVNHGTNCSASSGQIALQAEGSEVEFRKILLTPIRELTATPYSISR